MFSSATEYQNFAKAIQSASDLTPELVERILGTTCTRLPILNKGGEVAARVVSLMQHRAWVDLGLALVEIELPGWTLRQLVRDGGEWRCILSRNTNMPIDFDDCAEAHHEVLALAVFAALLEALKLAKAQPHQASKSPLIPGRLDAVICDNFG